MIRELFRETCCGPASEYPYARLLFKFTQLADNAPLSSARQDRIMEQVQHFRTEMLGIVSSIHHGDMSIRAPFILSPAAKARFDSIRKRWIG